MGRVGSTLRTIDRSDARRPWRPIAFRSTVGALTLGLLTAGSVVLAPAASASAVLNVTTTADVNASAGACGNTFIHTPPSPLSLREATCLANNIGGAVTINVPAGTYSLENGELHLGDSSGDNATIVGSGAASTTIDGGGVSRVLDLDFAMTGGVTTSITGVTIRNGKDNTFGGAGIIGGAGNSNLLDTLTISNSVITGNQVASNAANYPGGGVQFVGGSLTVTNSTISNNSSGNSSGSGVAYESTGTAPGEQLRISGSTFSGNTATAGGANIHSGGALVVSGVPTASATVSDSRFLSNSVTGSGTGTPLGGAILQHSGTLAVTGSTFTGNSVSGGTDPAGGAISVFGGGSAQVHYNRFTGNTAARGSAAALGGTGSQSLDATNNWWGCNTGPVNTGPGNTGADAAGCDTIDGTFPVSPRLVLSASANPSTVTGPNGTSTITAALTQNDLGLPVNGSQLGAFTGLPISWSDPQPGGATVAATTSGISSGAASTTYNSHSAGGAGHVVATLDNASVTAALSVNQPPAITSANTAAFRVGSAGSFTVATSGYPAPAITETGSLPAGLTFTDNGNGTATIAGTPTGGGTFPINLTANNGVAPNATQTLALNVVQPPAFTSPSNASFRIGTAGSFTVTTSGVPTVSGITESGPLPAGLTFTDNGNGTATIAGTPTGTGNSYPLTLTAANGVTPNATQNLTVQVNQAPAITTNPADQTVSPGSSATFTAAASGVPMPTVQWQRSDVGGAFRNIPGATSPTYTFSAAQQDDGKQYRAVFYNSTGSATSTAASLSVGTAPAITSADHATFAVGAAASFPITTSGVPSATLSQAGAFPAWLALTDNGDGTGSLTGTPPAGSGGTYAFTLKAANGFSPSASQNFTLTVTQSPVITSAPSATFTRGSAGSFTVTATAGFPTATTLTATTLTETGALPAGVSFTDHGDGTATLAGTPTGQGDFLINVRASNGVSPDAVQAFVLTVKGPPAVSSADHTTFAVGSAGNFTVTTTPGTPRATTLSQTGVLPDGVTFTDNGNGTATLAGTPTAGWGGAYPISIAAANGIAPDAHQAFTLIVDEPSKITSLDSATFTRGSAGSFTVTTAPGTPANTTLTQTGGLPAGVTFTDNGDGTATIAGTTAAHGSFPFTITASNGVLPDDVQAFTLTVNAPPAITSADHTTFTAGTAGSFTVTTTAGTPSATMLTKTGTLPAGVTFTDNGDGTATLAGTPAAGTGGNYALTLAAGNGIAPNDSQSFTLAVNEAPSVTTQPSNVATTSGSSVTFTAAAGGSPAPTVQWQASTDGQTYQDLDGKADPSLTFTADTSDNGTRLRAVFTNAAGQVTTEAATLTVGTTPAIISADHRSFTAGTTDGFTVTATGSPTPGITVSGALPDGVTFTDHHDGTASFAGTPAIGSVGAYPVTVTAANGIAPNDVQSFTLTVAPVPLVITTSTLPAGEVGSAYSASLAATGGTSPYTWSLFDGSVLPAGLTLHADGTIDGTPTTAGTTSVAVQAVDAATPQQSVHATFSLIVAPSPITAPSAPTIGSATGGNGTATVRFTPPSSNGGAPVTGYTVTSTPGNVTATGSTSPITVTGLANGTSYTFTVSATNSAGTGAASAASNPVTPAAPTAIDVKYAELGGSASFLGAPVGPEYAVAGGTVRNYQNGRIYSSTATGAHEVHGGNLARYLALGGPAGALGFPTTDESATVQRTGFYNHFAGAGGASIFWSPATGAHAVTGPTRDKWIALGAEHGALGYPTTDTSVTAMRTGTFNHFAAAGGASIFWSRATGARSITGAVRTKWIALGAEHGLLGYPTTDTSVTAAKNGAYSHFAGANGASIFWSPATGAWSVHGAIRTKWIALGAERGRLGYPTSDEYAVSGGRRSNLAHGSIVWRAVNGALTVTYK